MTQGKSLEQAKDTKSGINVTFEVAGKDVTLTEEIVRCHIAKGNSEVTRTDIVSFTSLCLYNKLNPFLNEAYLVKYSKDAPAQMVVSKEAFMKRAEAHEDYTGNRAGIIVLRNKEIVELEGTFFLPSDTLVGGWAEVYRQDRKFPTRMTVSLTEYDTKKSLWNQKPSTMIRKVALVQALREAFPAQLGAMYTSDEINDTNAVDAEYQEVKNEQLSATSTQQVIQQAAQPVNLDNAKANTISLDEPKAQPQAVSVPKQQASKQDLSATKPLF